MVYRKAEEDRREKNSFFKSSGEKERGKRESGSIKFRLLRRLYEINGKGGPKGDVWETLSPSFWESPERTLRRTPLDHRGRRKTVIGCHGHKLIRARAFHSSDKKKVEEGSKGTNARRCIWPRKWVGGRF